MSTTVAPVETPTRRHRPHLAGPRRIRRTGAADAGPDRPPHRPAALVGASDARAPGAAALAAPQRSRLRAGHAAGRAGLAGRAPGPPGAGGRPAAGRIAPRHRACRAPRGSGRTRCRLPGEDRRSDAIPTRVGGRRARALHRRRQGDAGLLATTTRQWICGSARPDTRSPAARNWPPNWPRCGPTAWRSSARSRCSDSVVSQRLSGARVRPSPRCRCAVR